jgi:hypothetical protein
MIVGVLDLGNDSCAKIIAAIQAFVGRRVALSADIGAPASFR